MCYYAQPAGSKLTRKPTQIVQIKLRLQERLRREVEKLAKKSGRSLNGELVALIELALEIANRGGRWAAFDETIEALSRSMAENTDRINRVAENMDRINRLLDVQREHARSQEKRGEREKSAPPNTERAGEKSE